MKTATYIEIAWVERSGHLTYIDPNIETLVGWTVAELRGMNDPIHTLAPDTIPSKGPKDSIIPRTMPLTLRHRDGHSIAVEATFICLYGPDEKLAEVWGAIRRMPHQALFNDIRAWWESANAEARHIVHDTILMYPVAA